MLEVSGWQWAGALVAPALLWIGYIYVRDRLKPEPWQHVASAYLLGIGAAYLSLHLYRALELLGAPTEPPEGQVGFLLYFLIVVGPTEELAKFLPFILVCTHWKEFDEVIDGFVYASAIALGFASYETFVHLPYMQGVELYGSAITLPLVHTVFASIWGLACGWAKAHSRSMILPGFLGLVVASLLHGIYDFLALSSLLTLGGAALILVLWVTRTAILRRLHDQQGPGAGSTDPD